MAITDKFTYVGTPGSATYLASPGYTIGGTSQNLETWAGWPTGTVHYDIYTVQLDGTKETAKAGTRTQWKAIHNGSGVLSSLQRKGGTDQNYPAGTNTRVIITHSAYRENEIIDGILAHADEDGTLKAGAVDGTSVIADNIVSNAKLSEFQPVDGMFDHISSGCVWSGDSYGSTRNASCTSGVVYIAGKRLTVAAVSARSFTASKDVYCDLKDNGGGTAVWVYYDNTTNAASPAFATTGGTMRGAIIVVGASSITNVGSINMGEEYKVLPIASSTPYAVTDSLGNLICPRDPIRRILGLRVITANFSTSSASQVQVTGLSVPVIVPTGRKVRISVYTTDVDNTTNYSNLNIWDGTVGSGTQLTRSQHSTSQAQLLPFAVVTPTSSSKTYNAGLSAVSGTSLLEALETWPAYIMVELL